MKIAFDVQGTLEGRHSKKVVELFHRLQALGHECYVWSFGGHIMARDAAYGCNIKPVACMSKRDRDYDSEPEFQFCIDDDSRTAEGLDAARVVYVHEIPELNESDRWTSFMKDVFNG